MIQSSLKDDGNMKSIEKQIEKYAIVFNVNLDRATLIEAVKFKDYLTEALKDSDKDIVVNLSSCEHLDSTFLGALVSTYKILKKQNRTVALIEPENQSSILLTLNSIGKIFPLYKSVKVALDDIENKKLLESELNALADEQSNNADGLKPTTSEMEIETVSKDPVVQFQEMSVNESEPELEMSADTQEITNEQEYISNKTEESPWNYKKYHEMEFENNPDYTSEAEVNSESLVNDDEVNDTIKYEVSHSGEKYIKWEFGFSS